MGYFRDYFGKESDDLTINDIDSFITQNNPESLTLEYKRFDAISNADKISIVLSSFANSIGGLFILGIAEEEMGDTILPQNITFGDIQSFPKERVESLLISRIFPKIDGLIIKQITCATNPNQGIYVFDIPQGKNPPYLAGDKRYYKRYNFQKLPMEGYEIADYYGRRKSPRISVQLSGFNNIRYIETERRLHFTWKLCLINVGNATAKDLVGTFAFSHAGINGHDSNFSRQGSQDPPGRVQLVLRYPISIAIYPFPDIPVDVGDIHLYIPIERVDEDSIISTDVSYRLLSDNMPLINGSFRIKFSKSGEEWSIDIENESEEASII